MTTEDEEAMQLMAKWDAEHGDVVSDGEDNENQEILDMDDLYDKYRRDVTVTDSTVDHIVLGTSDLQQAMDDFEAMTGVRPLGVTSMNGLGTASARVAFESCVYLEIVGPDPKQTATTTPLAEKLAEIETGKLVPVHYAARNVNVAGMKESTWTPFAVDKITMVDHNRGVPLIYDYYILENHQEGGLIPNFVQWPADGSSDHPASKLPIVGTLECVNVRVADNGSSHVPKLLDGIDGVNVVETTDGEDASCLEFSFTTSKGVVSFSSSGIPIGVSFPKQGGLEVKEPNFGIGKQ